jgi:hypothetical protein
MSLRPVSALFLVAWVAAAAPAAEPAAADPFLARLEGDWDLTGSVRGESVHQHAACRWVLKGGWLRFALTDLAQPPGYEASVFFSYDARAGDYIVHWLDQFGAAGARVVGSGHRDGETLVFGFPYAEGAFRDTLTLAADGRHGTLLIEQQGKDGGWSTFASYRLVRGGKQAQHRPE